MLYIPYPFKRCSKCGGDFPPTPQFFNKKKGGRYGLASHCKGCVKIYHRQYAQQNHEKMKRYQKSWKLANPDKDKARYARHRQSHIDEERRKEREYHRKHADRYKTYDKQYRKTERGKENIRMAAQRRRARKRNADGTHTATQELEQFTRQKGKCYYCGKKMSEHWHPDHVVPLSRGGSDDISNIVIACPSCNQEKWAKFPHEWPEGGRLL